VDHGPAHLELLPLIILLLRAVAVLRQAIMVAQRGAVLAGLEQGLDLLLYLAQRTQSPLAEVERLLPHHPVRQSLETVDLILLLVRPLKQRVAVVAVQVVLEELD
jgi:hypothetical protein